MKPNDLKSMCYPVVRIFTLAGGFFFHLCFISHVCMAGHMHHPPYSTVDYAIDYIWLSFLIVAILATLFWRTKESLISSGVLLVLILNRSFLESNGGMGFLFEIPLLFSAFAMLVPQDWFKGFFRRHVYLPIVFLSIFLFGWYVQSLRLALQEEVVWWMSFHPKMLFTSMFMVSIPLVIVSNELMQKLIFRKRKVQPPLSPSE